MTGKLEKYRAIKTFTNVIENPVVNREPLELLHRWREGLFPRSGEMVLELGCGRGEYTCSLAGLYPEKNFLGIDRKGGRIYHGALQASREKRDNVLFVRMLVDHLAYFFPQASVSEIWIPFPDPLSRHPGQNESRRLSSKRFLRLYRGILTKGGVIHLKTDSSDLFNFSVQSAHSDGMTILHETDDLHDSPLCEGPAGIMTRYERRYLLASKKIKYLAMTP